MLLFLQGCRSPLVVKFADTQKEKEMKKLQQMQANLLNAANLAGLGALGPQYLAVSMVLVYIIITLCLSCVILDCFDQFPSRCVKSSSMCTQKVDRRS